MPRGPRQLTTEAELYTAAVEALARRAHSSFEMRKYLERRAADGELVPQVLARLRAEKLIDDERYAASFARARSANRRQGPLRIARELRSRGVADRHIEAAVKAASSPESDSAALRRRIEIWLRRHGMNNANALDRKRSASLYRSLLAAGFPGDRIRAELGRRGSDREELPPDGVEEG
ncbi:MAG TPA: regulatory protein RecX [Candidatus Dormibacteraeota bacterium]|nr:regulatory protein RecX [Candidatus Dormibacteraeota bacterium]